MKDEPFLSRWSRRKAETKVAAPPSDAPAPPPPPAPAPGEPEPAVATQPLPAVESLTPESDFTPFMKPEVDAGVKRQALKKLFEDPQFNVMDGLDVYIDDYSKPDPLPEGWLEKMNQVRRLGIFREAAEDPEDAAAGTSRDLRHIEAEQRVASEKSPSQADNSADAILPSGVGKSGVSKE